MSCIKGKGPRSFCGQKDCMYHFEKSFASFQGMCCGASDVKECEENGCNCNKKKVDCWDKEKNRDSIPIIVSKSSGNPYYFICSSCNHSWKNGLNAISNLKDPRWCPECGKKKTRTWSNARYIKEILKVHDQTYGYDKTKYIKMSEPIEVKCHKHGYFTIPATSHLRGRGCMLCGIEKSAFAKRYTLEEITSIGKILHSGKYVYLSITKEGRTVVSIQCPDHGVFEQSATSHMSGKGCRRCSQERIGEKNRRLFAEYTDEANKIHDNYYKYVSIHYENQMAIFVIECPTHGLFEQSVMSHLDGRGCSACGIIKRSLSRYLTNDMCIQRSNEMHGNLYDYSLIIYKGYYEPIQIICKKHGQFWMKACHHFKGYGCYSCNKRSSRPAREWLSFIKSVKTNHIQTNDSSLGEYRIPSNSYFCDGYDSTTLTIYEFNGSFWHGDPYVYSPDTVNNVIGKTMVELYQKTQKKRNAVLNLDISM
jgi:hypothetical protein